VTGNVDERFDHKFGTTIPKTRTDFDKVLVVWIRPIFGRQWRFAAHVVVCVVGAHFVVDGVCDTGRRCVVSLVANVHGSKADERSGSNSGGSQSGTSWIMRRIYLWFSLQ